MSQLFRKYFPLIILSASLGCASTASPPLQLAHDAFARGDFAQAWDDSAKALCEEPKNLKAALFFIEVWRELGSVGSPLTRVESCDLPLSTQFYIKGLHAGLTEQPADAILFLTKAQAMVTGEDRAEIAYRLSRVELLGGQFEAASAHLDLAMGLAPQRVDFRLARAELDIEGRNFAAALQILTGILKLQPSHLDIKRARQILSRLHTLSATPIPEEVGKQVETLLAKVEEGTARPIDFQSAQELSLRYPVSRVLVAAGLVALQLGIEEEGYAFLLSASEKDPLSSESLRILATSLVASDRGADAFPHYRSLMHRAPFDTDARRQCGMLALKEGDVETGLVAWGALVKLQPEDLEAWLWLARLQRQAGQATRALLTAQKGLGVDPEDLSLLVEVVSIATETIGQSTDDNASSDARELAESTLERLEELAPQHPALGPLKGRLAKIK
ncbi:hypothetical protein KAI87_08495 [Myxococcota bacterium]|nr:hypothetical protein [Myxococcota bacterium]